MLEQTHETNTTVHVIRSTIAELLSMTLSADDAKLRPQEFCMKVNRSAKALEDAFSLLTLSLQNDVKCQGFLPLVMPKRCSGASRATDRTPRATTIGQGSQTARVHRKSSGGTTACQEKEERRSVAVEEPHLLSPSLPHLPNRMVASTSSTLAAANPSSAFTVQQPTNPKDESVESIVSTGVYMMLDALARELKAREGAVYLTLTRDENCEDAQAIALFGGKPRSPHAVRVSLRSGVVGAVIRTGIAVNVKPDAPTDSNPYTLCYPIFPTDSRTHPIGVVYLQHRVANTPFSECDEQTAKSWSALMSHLVCDYRVDLLQHHFDPHRLFSKRITVASYFRQFEQANGANDEVTNAIVALSYPQRLAALISKHPTPQFVFRCVQGHHFTTTRNGKIPVGKIGALPTQNLVDVADYIANLEECWKRSVEDFHGLEMEHVERMQENKDRKRKLKAAQKRIGQLESVSMDYKHHYDSLREEVSKVCGAGEPVAAIMEFEGSSPRQPSQPAFSLSVDGSGVTTSPKNKPPQCEMEKRPSHLVFTELVDGSYKGGSKALVAINEMDSPREGDEARRASEISEKTPTLPTPLRRKEFPTANTLSV